jgi:DNA-binding transcriptional ArsR family regulator
MVTLQGGRRPLGEPIMQARISNMAGSTQSIRRAVRRKQRDAVFRALADPTRREILSLLRGGQQTVGEIAGHFPMSRPAISKHLRLLRSAGLVVTRQEGTSRHCGLNAKPLRAIDDWLQDYEMFWSETMQSLKSYVEEKQ